MHKKVLAQYAFKLKENGAFCSVKLKFESNSNLVWNLKNPFSFSFINDKLNALTVTDVN